MQNHARSVTVSIVSHGNWAHIQPLLRQLSTRSWRWIDRVVLTLNVPEQLQIDEDLAFAVDIVHNSRPRGFGANHNAAFARVGTPWFLVLNPDLCIDEDVIGGLLSGAAPEAALIAPRVMEPGRLEPEPYRTLATPVELLHRRWRGHTPPDVPDWIAGMFMLLRTSAYREIGGFDERFFMYCEDVDLCLRLQTAEWKLQIATDIVVHHEAKRDSHSSMRALAWHLTSLVKLWTSSAFWNYLGMRRRRNGPPHFPAVLLSRTGTATGNARPKAR